MRTWFFIPRVETASGAAIAGVIVARRRWSVIKMSDFVVELIHEDDGTRNGSVGKMVSVSQ